MQTDTMTARTAKVLVVDDDADFRHSTARTLTFQGYTCVEAASTAEARVVLEAEDDVSAVLCDINMPDQSGIELLATLADHSPDLAVVMTTGVDDVSVAEEAFHLGAFGYVVKPFEANELLINLAGALRRRDLESDQRRHREALQQTIARTRMLAKVLDRLDGEASARWDSDEEVIDRLARAVSLRDEETGRHIERMSRISVVIAKAADFKGLTPDELRLASALHDVGKIGIPDAILLKPGPLSADERVAMERHAQIGYQLLRDSTSPLLRIAADIALTHHECWDGTGYPRGLEGSEIPEAARIAAVADVFDAVSHHRVYRPALPIDQARELIRGLAGHQLEPRLVAAFFAAEDEIRSIGDQYPELGEAQDRIRVLVVDDHAVFTQSLVRLLGSRPQLDVVGTAGSVAEAITAALAHVPDVILMDFDLPDGTGPEAAQQIKALNPAVHVIMLTVHTDDRSLVQAIEAGCCGFVKKEEAVEVLLDAIVAVYDGEMLVSPSDLPLLLRGLRATHRGLGADLTRRETEVLELISGGSVNKLIAKQLGLRLNTVRNHVQNILNKLQAHSKLEAVATAVREGIIAYPTEVGRV